MKHLPLLMYTTFCGLYSMQTEAADKKGERPNILWLTFEDTSAYEFGCYVIREYILPMQTVLLLVVYNLWMPGLLLLKVRQPVHRSLLDAIQALTEWIFILFLTIHLLIYSFHNGCAKLAIIAQTIAKHITILPLTTKVAGTSVITKPLTTVLSAGKTSLFLLYSLL